MSHLGPSAAKKRRLAALEGAEMAARAKGGGAGPAAANTAAQSAPARSLRMRDAAAKSQSPGRQGQSPGPQGGADPTANLQEPVYSKLDASIATGPLAHMFQGTARSKGMGDARGTLEHLTDELLLTNSSTALRSPEARAAAGLRVQDKSLLLDNPSAKAGKQGASQQGSAAPGYAKGLLSKRKADALLQKHSSGSLQRLKFADLLPLHTHWQQYITGLTGSARLGDGTHDATTLSKLVLAADLHGCCLEVVQSRDGRVVGAAGIVAKNTTSTLHIVDRSDKTHVVPKRGSVFALWLPGVSKTIHLSVGAA